MASIPRLTAAILLGDLLAIYLVIYLVIYLAMSQKPGVIGAPRHRLFVLVSTLRALLFVGLAPERNDKLFGGTS